MHAEILAIGDELTSGERLDTNSQWLAQRLEEMGIPVWYHATVGDDLAANELVWRTAIERSDLVISTGGLGPTADDLTREVLADVTGRSLELNSAALEHVEGIFSRRGREMPEKNRIQAMFPQGSEMIHNPDGTAPGILLEQAKPDGGLCRIISLPGVPAEMKQMWGQSVADYLGRAAGKQGVIRHRRIKCFGAGESHLEQMLPDLIRRGREPRVGITVSGGTITLRITAHGEDEEAAFTAMQPTICTIRETLGTLVFGEEDEELEHAVIRLLREQGRTLSTVEWGTGGLIAMRLAAADPEQLCYTGGDLVRRVAALGEEEPLVAEYGAISGEVTAAMAERVLQRTEADITLAVGKFPAHDPQASPPPTVWYALATPCGTEVIPKQYAAHPAILQTLYAKHGLNAVRLALLKDA